jgi:asparagine synthase (glutamine-hydrolysing)
MAAFAFVLSETDAGPVGLSEAERKSVFSALRERSPGPIDEREGPGFWGALEGPLGDVIEKNGSLLLCDGFAQVDGASGNAPLLGALEALSVESERVGSLDAALGSLGGVSGSFAACYFDGNRRRALLIRDRVGSKPLFYARFRGWIAAASECKVLQALGLRLQVDTEALHEALMYRWVTGERSLLAPALRVGRGSVVGFSAIRAPESGRYWRLDIAPEPMEGTSFSRYQDAVDSALRQALARLRPRGSRFGVLLSGGVDSSILTALAKEELGSVVAYTARIAGFDNTELERASLVAKHLGVEHRIVDVDPGRLAEDLPFIVRRLEELPRHPNNLVLLQILRQAGKEVDVMLQGDAADTIFSLASHRRVGRYNRKRRLVRWLPAAASRAAVRTLERLPSERAWLAAQVLAWDEVDYVRTRDALEYRWPARKALGLSHLDFRSWDSGDWDPLTPADQIRQSNLVSTGIQGSLIRHDRLSRSEGLESVAPYLSAEPMAVGRTMPRELLTATERTKPVLRAICDRYLPPEVSRWTKGRFEVPWGEWLFGDLRALCIEAAAGLNRWDTRMGALMDAAVKAQDREGAFSGLTLHLLLKGFGLL